MPNRSTDALFQLIKSLEKSEKRNFKLYVNRNSGSEDLKIVQLFDALDKMEEYDEVLLLKKTRNLQKQQLSNIKAHLYRNILSSLRILKDTDNIDLQLHEQMDYARILYNKGLYHQALKVLDRLKDTARTYNQFTYQMQAIFFEKKIEALHITRSMQDRAERLSFEASEVVAKLDTVTVLSNLSLLLYSWYIRNGHARNENEVQRLTDYLQEQLPAEAHQLDGFYEKLYLYQSYCWYSFIRQDFLMYYRYAQKWVDLFEKNEDMKFVESGNYIKGIHNLLGAHFDLQNYAKFNEELAKFEQLANSKVILQNENNRIQFFIYLSISKINKHFMEGTFTEGLQMVPYIEEHLKEYHLYLDRHRVLVFYYKIASLYFGSGDYENTIEYLNRIINWKVDLRTDLQCYSRLLHLIAHYELGNYELIEYLAKSVYRFMAKMENLSLVEEYIFEFLKQSLRSSQAMIRKQFRELYEKLKAQEMNVHEARAFAYLDILSWLESKINNVPVQEIIRRKYLEKNVEMG